MTRKGFYFNSERCVGCKTCMVACKKKNNLPAGAFFWRVSSYEVGEFPTATMHHWSRTCNHCANPRLRARVPHSRHVPRRRGRHCPAR